MTGLSLHDRHEEQTTTSASRTNMREQQTMTSMSLGTDQVIINIVSCSGHVTGQGEPIAAI